MKIIQNSLFKILVILLVVGLCNPANATLTQITANPTEVEVDPDGPETVTFRVVVEGRHLETKFKFVLTPSLYETRGEEAEFTRESSQGMTCGDQSDPFNCELNSNKGTLFVKWRGNVDPGRLDFTFRYCEKPSVIGVAPLKTRRTMCKNGGIPGYSEFDSVLVPVNFTAPKKEPGQLIFEQSEYTKDENAGVFNIKVFREDGDGSDGEVSVDYRFNDVKDHYFDGAVKPATIGEDYKGSNGTLKWKDGENGSKEIAVEILRDSLEEKEDEYFEVELFNPTGGLLIAPHPPVAYVRIKDVPPQHGTLTLSENCCSAREDAGTVNVRVNRTKGSDGRISVTYQDSGPTHRDLKFAKSGQDYESFSGTLTWEDGDTDSKNIKITLLKDSEVEDTEYFALTFGNPKGGASLDFPFERNFAIEDVPPEFGRIRVKTNEVSIKENAGDAKVIVERLDGADGKVSIKYKTGADDDQAERDKDYKNTSGTITWESGERNAKTITIPILKDILKENDEVLTLSLSEVTGGATLDEQRSSKITIQDTTSFGSLGFKSANLTAAEDQGTITINVERTGGSDGAVSVKYKTGATGDSATADKDYKHGSGTLNWASGDSGSKQIKLELLRDAVSESDEVVTLTLENPTGNAILAKTNTAKLTIKDATTFGSLRFTQDSYAAREDAGAITIGLKRHGGNDGAVSIRVKSGAENDSAQAGSDYTALNTVVSWADGDSSEKTVSLKVAEDGDLEETESITLSLSEATGGAVAGNPSIATVNLENTTLPKFGGLGFSNPELSVSEGDGAVQFIVQRLGGSDGVVSVQYQIGVGSDSAVEGDDYTTPQTSGELTWEDKDISERSLDISILADVITEGEETLTIELSNPKGGASLAANAIATLTIQDSLLDDFTPVLDIISGDQQSGFPGNTLSPFLIAVNDGDTPAPGVSVSWSVSPADAGRLIEGSSTSTDSEAKASNQLEVLKGGTITVTATVGGVSSKSVQTRATGENPNTVVFTVNAGFQGSADLNPNQRQVGKSLDSACLALKESQNLTLEQQDLLATCEALETATPAAIKVGIARLTPEEVFAMGTATIDTADIQVTNVQSRINAIRLGSAGLDLSMLNMDVYGQRLPGFVVGAIGKELTGGSAGEGELSRLGVFVNGSFSFGKLDETDLEKGLDFDSQGLTVGMDYRTDDHWVYGGALGMVSHAGDFSSEGGSIELKGTILSAFATWYEEDDAYFDLIVNYGQNSFDLKRRINLPDQAEQFAKSTPDAMELALNIGAGLEYYSGSWQYGPYGRLGVTSAKVDSYTEKASNPSAPGTGSVLFVEEQTLESSILVLGGQVSRTINTEGGVWIPQLRFELEHRLSDSNRTIEANFIHDPSKASFEIESEEVDTDYLNIGTGVSMVFENGKSGYIFYETRIGQERTTQHWIKGGIRLEF